MSRYRNRIKESNGAQHDDKSASTSTSGRQQPRGGHSASSSSTASSSSSSSIRVRRRRARDEEFAFADDDFSISKVSVKGAGTSALAVQDAGTYQMLHDECTYLCSTILMSRTPSQAIDAAIDLAILLSNRNTRSVLWQGGKRKQPQQQADDFEEPRSTVFRTVLDVLAKATLQQKRPKTPSSAPSSPTRMRTKSARKRIKQSALSVCRSNDSPTVMTKEMRQVLASILYFLSWDCTMCDKNSVAAMGVVKSASLAKKLRTGFLEHGEALQAILNLMATSPTAMQSQAVVGSSQSVATSSPGASSHMSSRSNSSRYIRRYQPQYPNGSAASTPSMQGVGRRQQPSSSVSSVLDSSVDDALSFMGTVSSVSFEKDDLKPPPPPPKPLGDPTAAGRRGRRQQRRLQSVPETSNNGDQDDILDFDVPGTKVIPPPVKRRRFRKVDDGDFTFTSATSSTSATLNSNVSNNMKNGTENTNEDNSFTAPVSPPRKQHRHAMPEAKSPDDTRSVASSSIGSITNDSATAVLSAKASQKLATLLSKVDNANRKSSKSIACCQQHASPIEQDLPWVSMICLESFHRIVTGKGEGASPSCLETESDDDDDDDSLDEHDNPIMNTNRLLSKSQVLPMMGRVMGRSLQAVYDLVLMQQDGSKNCSQEQDEPFCRDCWSHWERRVSILAELLDGACLFHKSNRTAFCESDPFMFDERNGGLICYIVIFLKRCSRRLFGSTIGCNEHNTSNGDGSNDNNSNNHKLIGIMLLALRTLTSLTHDNELAAEQMTVAYPFLLYDEDQDDDNEEDNRSLEDRPTVRGVDVLAELVYELEQDKTTMMTMTENRKSSMKPDDEALHRFDCTIFCLNTLANIIEAGDVRRTLAEITVVQPSLRNVMTNKKMKTLWLKWLCGWLVNQTESFQDAIFGIGKKRSAKREPDRELQKNEEDRLVAAGNGCVLLACMMKEPEEISEEPESTNTIRQLIVDQLPRSEDGNAGYILIINTLKAFCNFYHFSLGDLSVAIVTPVKKLIGELQELERQERKSRG